MSEGIRNSESRFIDVKKLAKYLDVSEAFIRDYIKEGRIPFVKLGRLVRFDLWEIEKWLKDKRIANLN